MKNYFFFFLLVSSFLFYGQNGSYYGNPSDAAELCGIRVQASNSFSSNQEAQKALDKIIAVTGISKRFALYQCSGINNCEAITFRGIRYIFYDQNFMKSITATAGSWTNLSILAHEVGHHVNAHSLDWLALASGEIQGISLEQKRQQEIEADEFSGFVLAKLGATLIQAQAAIKLASDDGDDTYSTHPSRSKRLSAIERGYNQAKGITTKPYATVTLTSEDYFYLAYNSDKNDVKILNYTKCLQLNSGIITAYLNRGNVYKDEKRFTEALSDFDKVIDLAKNSKSQSFKNFLDDGYRGKGWCYNQMIYKFENDFKYYNDKAIIEMTNAINADPSYENYYSRGMMYFYGLDKSLENSSERQSMANKSLSDFNKAEQLNSNEGTLYSYRGLLFWDYLNDKSAALRDYLKQEKLEPNNIWPIFSQGNIYLELGNFEKAIEKYNSVIKINQYGLAYFNRALTFIKMERYTDAFNDLNTCISIAKDTTNESYFEVEYKLPEIYWKRAKVNELLKNYSAAVSDYSKIIEITKNDPGVYTYLDRANSYIKLKRNDLALADFNKAILIDQTNPDSYHSRGYFYQFTLEKNEKALEDYNKAINLDSDYLPSYYNRGLIFGNIGNPEKAIADFTKYIENSKEQDADAYYYRGLGFKDLDNFNSALEDFNSAIQINPDDPRYYRFRGLSKSNLGNNEGAIDDYNESIRLDNNYSYSYMNRADSYYELGQYQNAILDYTNFIQLEPKNPDGYINRGVSKAILEKWQEAILDYNKAIELNVSYGLAYYNRAEAKHFLGNKMEACIDWKKALALGYKDAQVQITDKCN
jgi:tetratricopeptide (TPR) repeat protein